MTTRARRALLVALEGIDGAGKSSLAVALAGALRRRGESVRCRREPVDPRIGRLAQLTGPDDPWTSAIYFTVDRHLALPELERDLARFDIVLTDRSFFSTLAYQGSLLGPADRRRLETLERSATIVPDRVILLDLPPRVAWPRVGRRTVQHKVGRGPLERRRTLERVARAYRNLARQHGWIVLDAREPPRQLLAAALARLAAAGGRVPRSRKGNRYPPGSER